jgi:mannose-6-phosphate isomerase
MQSKYNNYYAVVMLTSLSVPPLPLAPNYVWRSYRGGSRLRAFRGQSGTPDDHFPEDWLASTVRARNGAHSQGPDEGLSQVPWRRSEKFLAGLAGEAPEYFGGRPDFGVLLKLLDSAERLHVQAHPNDHFVRARLGGTTGKTECWYVISTREEEAWVLLGLQKTVSAREWERMVMGQDLDAMLGCFERITVRPGDCLMVPAGVPHAIGAGVFLLELQQPSDWVVRCEFTVGDHTLPPEARFMGLEYADCRDIFDLTPQAPGTWRQTPCVLSSSPGHVEEEVIEPRHHEFFRLRRLRGTGRASFALPGAAVLVMTSGTGRLDCGDTRVFLQQGRTLLLPASPEKAHWEPSSREWEFLLAQPPSP